MRFFEKQLTVWIVLCGLPLLFLPKINLLSIGSTSETAGIRIDDIFLLFFALLVGWAHFLLKKRFEKIEAWILLLTFFALISFLFNRLLVAMDILHVHAKIFYAVRILEYFLFFYIGAFAARFFTGAVIVRTFFIWNLILMLLQKFNLVGAVTVTGYASDVSARAQGIASFPSEMGLLLNLLFCYIIFNEEAKSKTILLFPAGFRPLLQQVYLYGLFLLFGILVVLTGNRISILALFICFLAKLKEEIEWRSLFSLTMVVIVISVLLTGITYLVFQTAALYERSAGLFSTRNVGLITTVWDRIDMTKDPIGNESVPLEDYDVSWWIRIHKWIYAFKIYLTHPICYLQGVGPGFAWSALDGGWLRILTEYGLLGCFFFGKLFGFIYRINRQLQWMMIAFAINMIFFDAYLAYKTMSFLFFAAGHAYTSQLITNHTLELKTTS